MTHQQRRIRRAAIAEYAEKHGVSEASEKFGVCVGSVHLACRQFGTHPPITYIAKPRADRKPETGIRILAMLLTTDKTHAEIGAELSVTRQRVEWVRNAAREAGLDVRNKKKSTEKEIAV